MKKRLLVGVFAATLLVTSGCSLFDSTVKNIESDTKGLNRTIYVYSYTGELLKEYKGERVRIETENETNKVSVMVDGKRLSFYNATVVIEEN
ncbi:MAG: DUF5052 family protein [Bacilli bacterium]